MDRLWNGKVQGSGRFAVLILGVLTAGWLWFRVGGIATPESVTAVLLWTYLFLGVFVAAALLAGAALRVIFLRIRRSD